MVGVSAIMTKDTGDTQPSISMRNNRFNGEVVYRQLEKGRGRGVKGTAAVGQRKRNRREPKP